MPGIDFETRLIAKTNLAERLEEELSRPGYVLLRLPLEVAPLFEEWLAAHFPARAAHVMSLIRQCRGGADYDSRFGTRMRGEGPFATLLAQRFALAVRRLGLNRGPAEPLDCTAFAPPGRQLSLF